ncbi:MAG: nitrilase-related carbon-nitrogen hydrolase [Pseudorhodobacter sp.]|nr:nitrilase-related carbon-nitrogen hydrolase [Pseudorhodobacter sp.]
MTLRLALWQGAGVAGDLAATVTETARIADLAAAAGAELLVFPEGYLTGYYIRDLARNGLAGVEAALTEVGGIAARTGLAIVIGCHVGQPPHIRNAAIVFAPTGMEIGRYYKRALFGAWEKATFQPGDSAFAFDLCGLRIGVLVCYDVEFPELVRAHARAGAALVVVPTALMAPHENIARAVVPVRAMENQIFLGYANRSGQEPHLNFVGLSRICGPRGEIITEAGADPALLLADIDPQRIAADRAGFDYLGDLAGLAGDIG